MTTSAYNCASSAFGVPKTVKFYRGSPSAARSYVEADRSRVDDYYLAEGTGLAERYVATPTAVGVRPGQTEWVRPEGLDEGGGVRFGGTLDGPAYERWVAGHDVETGAPKGRLRRDKQGLRFVEVVVNGPKTWSLAAALHPVAPAPVRHELAEDPTDRTVARCVPLVRRDDVPEHNRSLTSREVFDVEADLLTRLTERAHQPATSCRIGTGAVRSGASRFELRRP